MGSKDTPAKDSVRQGVPLDPVAVCSSKDSFGKLISLWRSKIASKNWGDSERTDSLLGNKGGISKVAELLGLSEIQFQI